jgi:hypothetical protein
MSITPDRGAAGAAVSVRIAGEGFGPPVSADFVRSGGDVIDARYQAFLGTVPLDDVALRQDGTLAASVPADLALGTHDLTVVDPAGRSGTLPGAYRALASPDAAAAVARFRVEPVAAQVAYAPFTVVVTALDAAGAVVADFSGAVQLSDASGTAVPASLGLFAAGRWTGSVEVRAARAGDVLTVTLPGGATGASAPFDVAPAPAIAVRFVTPAPQVQAGACAGPITVSLRDAFGLATTAAAPVTAAAAATSAGVTVYADAACKLPAGGAVVSAGQGEASFWLVATAAGPLQLSASAPSLSGDALNGSVGAGPPAALAFLTAPRTAAAGACSGVATVQLLDAYGNPAAPSAAATSVGVAGPGLTLFTDPTCAGGGVTSVAVPAGATTASLYFRGGAAGPAPLTASAAGLAAASQTETIVAAAATQLAFTTAPQTVTAGSCSGVATVQARDAWANPSAPSATTATTVALAAPGLTLHADAACATAAVTTVAIPAGSTAASLYFRGTAAGPATVTASAAGLGAASQAETLVAAPPTRLAFTTAPQTVTAGVCSGVATVQARDAAGNPSAPSPTAATALALGAPGLTLYTDAACATAAAAVSIPAAATSASFYFRGTAAGPATITASAAGLTPASQAETLVAAAATQLTFTTAAQAVTAGTCSGGATVQARDAWSNPSAPSGAGATAVTLAAPGLALYTDAACATAAVTAVSIPAAGTSATFYFRGTAAGPTTVTATATGLAAASQPETLVAGSATGLAFITTPQTVTAGACSGAATLQARDAWANPTAPSGTAATPVALAAPGLTLYTDAACATAPVTAVSIPAAALSASFYFRGTAAGAATVTATATGLTAVSQTETLVAASATQLAFTTAPQTVTAGACSGVATVEARDAWGNPTPVSGALPVTVALASGALTFHTDAACATAPVTSVTLAAASSSTGFYARGTVAGPATVTASAAGLTSAAQTETLVAAAASQLTFATAAQTVTAGVCSGVVTLAALDAWGNPGAVAPPAATSISVAGIGVAVHAGAGCGGAAVTSVTLAAGATSTDLSFVGTTAGAAAVTASAAGLTGASQGETIVAGAATQLAFATAAQSVTAGSCSGAVTVEALDAWGNPAVVSTTATSTVTVAAPGLTLHAGTGCAGGAVSTVALAAGTTTATLSFVGTTAGPSTLGASAAGLASASQVETITAGPTDHYVWSTLASPQTAGVPFAATITAVDAYGNRKNYSGTVTLSASSGTVSCATACTSATETGSFSNGQWSGTLLVPAAATGLTLTATGSGRTGTSAAFDVVAPPGRSPPVARFTASARVITSGNSITFDASGSTDGQTAASALAVSWHFEALDADLASTTAPDASPWTAWTTTKTATHAFLNNTAAPIIYRPRLAVRDTEAGPGGPDVGYTTETIVVLPSASNVCVVDTDSLVDDNNWANTCDVKGTDGRTSLAEAVRIANGSAVPMNIVFSGTRNIVGGGQQLWMNTPVRFLADPGAVVLDGVSLALNATGILVSGLEFTRLTTPIIVADASEVRLEDLYVHDGAGIEVRGKARVVRARMSGCSGVACVYTTSWGAYLALFSSDLQGPGTGVGVSLDTCATATPGVMGTGSSPYLSFLNGWSDTGSAFIAASVLTGFSVAVSGGTAITCPHPVVANVTFDRNGTGVRRGDAGGYVLDSVFTNHTVAAVDPAVCAFDQLARNLTWGNASDGCLASSTGLLAADPLFLDAAARDYRLQYASPAKDAGTANGTEVDDAAPGLYLGAAPDRGGRETW